MTASSLDTLTVAQVKELWPDLDRAFSRRLIKTYGEFVSTLLLDVDDGIAQLETNPELRQKDSEDRLTIDLVNHLRTKSYNATHESKQGGKIDLLVENIDKGFIWRCEAKIHSSYEYLFEGFQQLCTRYNRGTPKSNHGGFISYVRVADCARVMRTWQSKLPEFLGAPIEIVPCPSDRRDLSFISTHTAVDSGLPYTVRHMGVALHFDPQDRSAKKSRAKKTASKKSA